MKTFHMATACPFSAQGRESCFGFRAPVAYVSIAQVDGEPCSLGWANHVNGEINTKLENVRMGVVWRRMEKRFVGKQNSKGGRSFKGRKPRARVGGEKGYGGAWEKGWRNFGIADGRNKDGGHEEARGQQSAWHCCAQSLCFLSDSSEDEERLAAFSSFFMTGLYFCKNGLRPELPGPIADVE